MKWLKRLGYELVMQLCAVKCHLYTVKRVHHHDRHADRE